MHSRTRRPSPAMIVAVIALIVSLAGTAVAAKKIVLPKNSVGSKQLKSKSVTTGKIAPNAVNGSKVANESLTNEDIRLSSLQNVPSAATATTAGTADALQGNLPEEKHSAKCPGGTVLIRGLCYDQDLQGPVQGVAKAATNCAAKGGFLPTVMNLYTARNLVFLGTGTGSDTAVADVYYYDNFVPTTITVDGAGTIEELKAEGTGSDTKYICAYQLVR